MIEPKSGDTSTPTSAPTVTNAPDVAAPGATPTPAHPAPGAAGEAFTPTKDEIFLLKALRSGLLESLEYRAGEHTYMIKRRKPGRK